jgi:hypothetical protein
MKKDQRLQLLLFLEKMRDKQPLYSEEWFYFNERYMKILLPF